MKCPHCRVEFHDVRSYKPIGVDKEGGWIVRIRTCPACERIILHLENGPAIKDTDGSLARIARSERSYLVWPKGTSRFPCPNEVPKDIAEDYTEACLVFPDSPKASAALSRRCLQHLLREAGQVKSGNLADEIEQVLKAGKLPSHLAGAIDSIRNVGNFAAHPIKSEKSGEILDVESGEAEWNLDVLELLFDFYYVQPEEMKKKKDALNKKLAEVGKPPMKS